MRQSLMLFLVLVCVTAPASDERIFGGEVVLPTDPLYGAAPMMFDRVRLKCSLVLIDEDIILTAAHCTPGGPYEVKFDGDIKGDGPRRSIKVTESHPSYKQDTLEADIAVGRFDGGLPPGYRKIGIAAEGWVRVGDILTVLGFGTNVQGEGNEGSGILRKADLVAAQLTRYGGSLILDQKKGKGACYGDSGGPAIVWRNGTPFVAGIASYVDPTNCSGQVYYTRPSYYASWIPGAIKRLREWRE